MSNLSVENFSKINLFNSELQIGENPNLTNVSKVIVINPLNNWWSYKLTCEIAIRIKEKKVHVEYFNPGLEPSPNLQPNLRDYIHKIEYPNVISKLREVLSTYEIAWKEIYRKDIFAHFEFNDVESISKWIYDGINVGKIILACVSGRIHSATIEFNSHKELIFEYINEFISIYESLKKIVSDPSIKHVYSTNDRALISGLTRELCHKYGKEFFVVYWATKPHKFLVHKESLFKIENCSKYANQNYCKTTALSARKIRKIIKVIRKGGLRDSKFGQRGDIEEDFMGNKVKKNLIFFTSQDWEFTGGTFDSLSKYPLQIDCVKSLLDNLDSNQWNIAVRHHPVEKGANLEPNLRNWNELRIYKNFYEIEATSTIDSSKLVDFADCVAVLHSTVGLEALCKGKKTIVFGHPFWSDYNFGISGNILEIVDKLKTDNIPLVRVSNLYPAINFLYNSGVKFKYTKGNSTYLTIRKNYFHTSIFGISKVRILVNRFLLK